MKKYTTIFKAVLIAVLIAFVFKTYLFASYIVDGESMEPTLYDGNLLMVNKIAYDIRDIDRTDVIVFHANPEEDYVKRVIGLPGDEISFENDILYINGEAVAEPYLDQLRPNDGEVFTEDFTLEEVTGETVVPEGELFVMGDNRRDSLDSRSFGFVSIEQIVGEVDMRYWPFSQVAVQF
ncbi:signal peptidase I [Halobacillus andaensis]|uniref:Signal peptidase I n=1 Tax=Halobacillus andaensis TaxID=1176239 RepID=A0A917B1B5_HALAA|nr:signal peptidase I [Halobacillus andaensis]MBP2004101.1 signal peptidase I [Halobacillus andaensis]GGF15806.1 signal peptidase I [Halobacillus andaensis]